MKRVFAGLLALMLVCSLFGCGNAGPSPITQATEPTGPSVIDTYTQAAAPLREAQNLKVELTTKKTITTLGGVFSSVSEQELTLTGIGTDAFAATLHEELEIGEYEDEFTEYFAGGVLYVNVSDDGYFQGDMSAATFLTRFAPAVLLDETLYGDVSSQESDLSVTLTFSNPTGPENWALPQGATFLSATGTAKITNNGALAETVYTVNYIQGSTTVFMEVTAEAEVHNEKSPEAPQNPSSYTKIDSIEVPRLYDTAILYIFGSETASYAISQSIICQAAGYTQIDQTELHYIGTGKDHHSMVQQSITSADSSGNTNTYTLTEKFQGGQYSYSENGGTFLSDSSVKTDAMVEYVQEICDDIPALVYIRSAKLEDVNGLLYLELGLTPEWGKLTEDWLSYLLFQDENFLDSHSSNYETTASSYYMFLDPATGFPVAAGFTYAGAHTIDGQKYILSQERTQSYRLADCSTYTELTGKLPSETAPEEQATPLLYRVTGANGQEMYLMGTIHAGDVKTGYLPDEVYAAFGASDALAVEADIIAFEEKLETDPQLAAEFAALFTNPGNSATKDQLDADLYKMAVKLLKASGNYSSSMEYVKPYVWSSSIEGFYLTLGSLRTEKGMDMRLLMLAKEQNKKILEVESALFQYEMIADFSSELQALLLGTAAATSVTDYCAEVQSLYDLWCTGDERALRESLAKDTSNMSDAERALYQEYVDAVIIERNDNMLDVAVSYLESDDTVFFAVGLAHLLQENGLVDTLRQAGYTVEQVLYS